MAYLHRSAERRADVRRVLPSARTVIVTGTIYNTAVPYSTEADPDRAQIARYAWGDDYHDVIGARLEALLAWMRDATDQPFDARAYVDTGPCRSASTRSTPAAAGLARTPARSVQTPARASFCRRSSAPTARSTRISRSMRRVRCLEACPTQAFDGTPVSFHPVHSADDRAARSDPGCIRLGGGIARLRLRHLPGGVPVEPGGAGVERSGLAATPGVAERQRRGALRDDRRGAARGDAGERDVAYQGGRPAPQPRGFQPERAKAAGWRRHAVRTSPG